MSRTRIVNGVVEQLTTEEISILEAEEKAWRDANPEPTELQAKLNNLREKRNYLLAKTDWTASSDLTMSTKMTEYRQKLRDATEGLDTVEKIEAYKFPMEVLK
tara:strand:+ start:1393 stop:1701 length:309 start_codon:yes stop_codon:yes gene_type:complete